MVHGGLTGAVREYGLWLLGRRRPYRVAGGSMAPTLADGDLVLVDPHAYRARPPVAGEVVLARHPFRDVLLVKRVGSRRADGRLSLHGDNPEESTDSRVFGSVPDAAVVGRVTRRLRS